MKLLKTVIRHPYFYFLLLVLLAYWPITLQLLAIPFDMTNCWVPWRHYISDTIQNGEFPWWNPYQQMGYPIHADLQGPTWHLESLLASMVGRQGIMSIQYTFLAYLYVGAIGMYKLTSLFTSKKWILFLAGAAYVCSGFFTNHSMHLFAVMSAAFVPLIIYHFIQMLQKGSWVHALWAAVFVFFNLTGGNQTFTIFSFYLLLPVFIHFAIKAWKEGKTARIQLVKTSAVFGGAVLCMGAVIFTVFLQVKPYLSRLSNLDYKAASVFPFPPEASMSFLNPMSTINQKAWLETDGTMANAYFGLLFFIFLLVAIISKGKTALDKIFLGFILVTLLASFGDHTPLHRFLYEYFPLLGKFRFPSYYIYCVMLCGIPLAAKALDQHFYNPEQGTKKVGMVAFFVGVVILAFTLFGIFTLEGTSIFDAEGPWFDKLRTSTLAQNWFYYGLIQLLFLGVLIYALIRKKLKIVMITVVLDCLISVQPNLFYITVGKTQPKDMEISLVEFNADQLPDHRPVKDNIYQNRPIPFLWQNVNHLPKIIGPDGFNSNYFSSLETLVARHKGYTNQVWNNSFVYLSNNVLSESEFIKDTLNRIEESTVLISPEDEENFAMLKPIPIHTKPLIKDVSANRFNFETNHSEEAALHLIQSYYPGWAAFIDGEETTVYQTNTMFMSVIVPPGQHEVEFRYWNKTATITACISYLSFLIAMVLLSVYHYRENKNSIPFLIFFWGVPLTIIFRYFFFL